MLDHRGAHGDTIDQQRTRVVEQAFAFEDLENPVRQPDLAKNGDCRCCIGRRDDGTECDRDRPRHIGHEPARDDGDCGDGQADRDDYQCHYGQPIVTQVAERGIVSGIEQHRSDEHRQCKARLQRPGRPGREKRQRHATDCQKSGVGHAGPAREGG